MKNPSKRSRDHVQDAVHHPHEDITTDVTWMHGTEFMTVKEMELLEALSVDNYPDASDITRRMNLTAIDEDEANQFPKSIQGIARGHLSSTGDGLIQEGEIIPVIAMADFYPHPGSTLYIDRKQTLPCHHYRTESGCKGDTLCPLVHIADVDTILCSEAALARSEQM